MSEIKDEDAAHKKKHGNEKHGLSGTIPYGLWRLMMKRCYDPKDRSHARYLDRGITVCDEWRNDRIAFTKWCFANGWKPGLQLERKNGDLGYDPSNVTFATRAEQQRHRCNNHLVFVDGREMCLIEASEMANVNYWTLRDRLNRGWPIERALTPVKKKCDAA